MSSLTSREWQRGSGEVAAAGGAADDASLAAARSRSRGSGRRLLGAVGGAVVMNALILGALAKLNAPPSFEPEQSPELRVVMQEEPEEPEPVEPEERQPEPERRVEASVAEVAVERPTPRMETPRPAMAMDLPDFDVAPPEVAVRATSQRAEPSPEPVAEAPAAPRATGPVEAAEADEAGRAVRSPQPEYPRVALRRRATGHVLARVLVDEDGRVEEVEIEEVAGHQAFESAVRQTLLSRWRYSTTRHNGEPVKAWHEVTIRFRLEG